MNEANWKREMPQAEHRPHEEANKSPLHENQADAQRGIWARNHWRDAWNKWRDTDERMSNSRDRNSAHETTRRFLVFDV